MIGKNTLFVSDLDGTLLNSQSKVSDTSARILHDLIANEGLQFTVATARTPATVEPLMAQVGVELPMIVMTGAAWWEPVGQRFVHTHTLPVETVRQIAEVCAMCDIHPFVYCAQSNDFIRVEHVEDLNKSEFDFVKARLNLPHKSFYLNNDVAPSEAYLVFACNSYSLLQSVAAEIKLRAIACRTTCYPDIFDNSIGYLEIFAPEVSKAVAIKELAHDIGTDRVIVFGDNLNDLPMFEIADMAIAPDNAFSEVKAAADEVIATNDHDSVAQWIKDNYR